MMKTLSERLRDHHEKNEVGGGVWYEVPEICTEAADALDARDATIKELREALDWYGEQARSARLIHSGGDAGRQALIADGGKRASGLLSSTQPNKAQEDEG